MHRRLACLAVALLVSSCSIPGFSPPPNYQYVVITAGGHENLSAALPSEPDAVEAWVRSLGGTTPEPWVVPAAE